MLIQPEISVIIATYTILLLFGVAFNAAVSHMEKNGYLEGYAAIAVVIGVLITLAGVAVINLWASIYAIGGFMASGTPMIVGSWWRHVQARRYGQNVMRFETRDER